MSELKNSYMRTVKVDGVELRCEITGSGSEPVVYVHGGVFTDAPLLWEPALNDSYRMIKYDRRGYGASSHIGDGSSSTVQESADCLALLHYLDVEKAHLVGHSYGGLIALQLALDAPEKVHTLSLLEPPLVTLLPPDPKFQENFSQIMSLYESGEKERALDAFLIYAAGAGVNYRSVVERALSRRAFEQGVVDVDTLFRGDTTSVMSFNLDREIASHIKQPILFVTGNESAPFYREVQKVFQEWLPQTEIFAVPGATHLLQMMNTGETADELSRFFSSHPITSSK